MRFTALALSIICVGGATAADPAVIALAPDAARLTARLRTAGWAAAMEAPSLRAWVAAVDTASPAWSSLLHGGGQARLRLDWGLPVGGLPVLSGTWAIGSPGQAPPAVLPLRASADGAWRFAALADRDLILPDPLVLPDLSGDEDLLVAVRLSTVPLLLPRGRAEACRDLLGAWRLDVVRAVLSLAEAVPERVSLPGAKLPIRAVEPEALAGVTGDVRLLLACGLDGAALQPVLPQLLGLVGGDPAEAAAWLADRCGPEWERIVASCNGTVVCALVGEAQSPGLLVGLPVGNAGEALLERWLTSAHPEPDEAVLASIREQVTSAASQPIPAGTIAAMPLFVRLDRGRLWLASAPSLLAGIGPDAPAYAWERHWPETPGAGLLAWWDAGMSARAAARLVGDGALARALEQVPSPAGWLALRQEADGVVLSGRAAATCVVPAAALAITGAPAMSATWRAAGESAARTRMARILGRCLSFRKATGDQWPRDIEDLRAWAKDLTDDDFAAAGRPDIRLPFRYVPAAPGAPVDQPVLVEDPACRDGMGSLVGFADGHIEYRAGPAHWNEARRLQGKPGIREHGVAADDWATRPKTF
ncbi:MAG: hypothetical protein J0M02_06595 [Planctomycetes bacterium]|nr:hypothetical protein [Planctomycetota bacterium]